MKVLVWVEHGKVMAFEANDSTYPAIHQQVIGLMEDIGYEPEDVDDIRACKDFASLQKIVKDYTFEDDNFERFDVVSVQDGLE